MDQHKDDTKKKEEKRDETEDKTREEYTETTKRAVLCPAAGPRTTQGTKKRTETDSQGSRDQLVRE